MNKISPGIKKFLNGECCSINSGVIPIHPSGNNKKAPPPNKAPVSYTHLKKDLDEAPSAYKNIVRVMADQEDLVKIKVELSPLAVVKG